MGPGSPERNAQDSLLRMLSGTAVDDNWAIRSCHPLATMVVLLDSEGRLDDCRLLPLGSRLGPRPGARARRDSPLARGTGDRPERGRVVFGPRVRERFWPPGAGPPST